MSVRRWPYTPENATLSSRYIVVSNYAIVTLLPNPTSEERRAKAATYYPEAMRLLAQLYPDATIAERAQLLGADVQRGLGRLAGRPLHLVTADA